MWSHAIPLPGFPRHAAAATSGLITTLGLLLMMHSLIDQPGNAPEAAQPVKITVIYRQLEDEPPHVRTPPELPPEVEKPPEPVLVRHIDIVDGGGGGYGWTAPIADTPIPTGGTSVPDSEALPIFKVSPNYPRQAASRGIEGYVIVRFQIDELGRVVDPVIVHAQPAGCFERSALEAVRKFKYKPRIVNGQPMRVRDVQHRLTYEMAES